MKKAVLSILFLSVLAIACNNKPKESSTEDTGLIRVTKAQFESEKMELGAPIIAPFSDLVHFTGTIFPSPDGWAQISLPVPGVISKILCKPGQIVGKGALLFEVSGNDLIDMQREFAESATLQIRLKSEFERVNELNMANIASKKEFIVAESAYHAERAKYNALKIKLENVGLDVMKIETGAFYPSYSLKSPIDGSVTRINANIGQYIDLQFNTAEIINARSLQLKLSIFENDISKVENNQIVEFYLSENKEKKYRSKIISVGKAIHGDTKSVECFAAIDHIENQNFVSHQFAEGDIFVATDSVLAVPETAIIHLADRSFVLLLEKETGEGYHFRKTEVMKDRTSKNLVELKQKIPAGKLLVKGTYNLQIE